MPPARAALSTLSRHDVRATQQLPRIWQILPPGRSRASCFWAHTSSIERASTQLRLPGFQRCRLDWRASFSTSVLRLSRPEDANKHTPKVVLPPDQQQNPPSPGSKLASKITRPHEQIYNIPNLLTFSRLIATPVLGYLIIHDYHLYAFGLFVYAGFSDLLDGWIARKWNLQTVVGSVVDPMADKALMTTLVTCLAINGTLPLPLATLILGRDVSLATAAIYFRYASLPSPKTFTRYWDFSLPSAEVHPTTISKLNTFLQLGLIGTTMAVSLLSDPSATESAAGGMLMRMQEVLGGPQGVETMVRGMSGVVAGTTMYSGLSYVWTKSAVKILGDDEVLKRKQGFRGRMIIAGTFGGVIALAAGLWWRELQRGEEEKEVNKE
ncbi:hypothetical protein K458DRAFT_396607 [Lentithecium fluviatile CBS 122367]|uniref:Cardiolipin synthetase n=1 Tax=Lentithecium fluviatile CBS 122367 TaxID=1168545 RepID=A0A6G1IES3_9PLEO|nr:hypothetical protein K458DRAFT_396607 [Lentithecium fluviatile CBS 122367]